MKNNGNPLTLTLSPNGGEQAAHVVHLLVEGVGIRAISRLTGLDQKTVLRILQSAGEHCARLLDTKIHNVKAEQVQADELVSFVRAKQYNINKTDTESGDFFTYLAIDRASKLIISRLTSKRNAEATESFIRDLKNRMQPGFQLNTDALSQYASYNGAVRRVFGGKIDYAIETKYFAATRPYRARRVIGIRRRRRIGNPDMKMATICHAERTNLTVRLFTRRFTRLTLGYSKTLENLHHAVALFIAHFNFVRVHSALKIKATDTTPAQERTPAQSAGLTDKPWTLAELLSTPI